jgi:NADH-quinone oxidoreductase subunit K
MFIFTVAAAEAAVGLAIVIVLFRQRDSVDVDDINLMKG